MLHVPPKIKARPIDSTPLHDSQDDDVGYGHDLAVTIYFDVSDLLQYCRDNRAPTGIQRVQIQVVEHATCGASSATAVAMRPGMTSWRTIDPGLFATLCALSRTGSDATDPRWTACVAAIDDYMAAKPDLAFPMASALVNLGSSWWLPSYFQALADAKTRYGLRYIPFVHDLIPVKVPEHCSAGLVCEFTQWIYQVLVHADAVLVNSRQTGADVKDLASRIHRRAIEPIVCTLDAGPDADAMSSKPAAITIDLERLTAKPFVLFVATIESRKNHLFVFDAWIDLVRKVGLDKAPALVCVGKRGWLAEGAIARRENSAILQEKLVLLSGISDVELNTLYARCLFTVYNSFYEGWGLPVTESLCAGKVPLVARNTSLVEAGGDHHAVYFIPGNREDFDARLHKMIFNADLRKALEDRIAAGFVARSWRSISEQILAEVAAEAFGDERDGHDRVEYGKTYRFCSIARPSSRHEDLRGALLRTGAGWSHPEDWGIWTTARSVRMEFRLPGVEGDVLVYLGLAMPSEPVEVSFHLNGWSSRIAPGRACLHMMRIPAAHLGDGRVVLDIVNGSLVDVSQHNPADKRVLGVGLRNLTVCRAGDFEARLAMIEGGESIVAIEARDRLEEVW